MADGERIAEGARWIVLADQEQQKSGWWQLVHALGLDRPEGMAIALLVFALFAVSVVRLSRGMDRASIAKSPLPSQRVGHAVATSVRSAPLAKKEKLRVKVAKHAEPGQRMGGLGGLSGTAGACNWRKVKPAEDDTPALWLCSRCNATYQQAEPTVPMTCLRGQ